MLFAIGRRLRHAWGSHTWILKGFHRAQGVCAWVWHCQYCPTSSIRAPFDDPWRMAGYAPFYPEWKADRDNQVGAESGGRGVYIIREARMEKKAA